MRPYDEMYPWELEEALDLHCIRLDGEIEEIEELKRKRETQEEEDDVMPNEADEDKHLEDYMPNHAVYYAKKEEK